MNKKQAKTLKYLEQKQADRDFLWEIFQMVLLYFGALALVLFIFFGGAGFGRFQICQYSTESSPIEVCQ